MKKQFASILNDGLIEYEFKEHDISKYDVLYHVTTEDRIKSIETNGLEIGHDLNKSITYTNMLFLSYHIDYTTRDLFRWYDNSIIVVLDAKKIFEDGIIFYDDVFSSKDRSSRRNHICCETNLGTKYIKKIIKLTENNEENNN